MIAPHSVARVVVGDDGRASADSDAAADAYRAARHERLDGAASPRSAPHRLAARARGRQLQPPSPIIHQLAAHDLLAAFLRASPLTDEIGLAAWIPEHAATLPYRGVQRPDAIALIRRGDVGTVLIVERDLGTERHEILIAKLERYRRIGIHPAGTNLGFVVERARCMAAPP